MVKGCKTNVKGCKHNKHKKPPCEKLSMIHCPTTT